MTEDTAQPDRQQERAAQRGSQSNPTNTPEVVRYSREELMENPGLLGVSSRAVAGGLAGQTKKTFTLDEAKPLVDAFLTTPASGGDS